MIFATSASVSTKDFSMSYHESISRPNYFVVRRAYVLVGLGKGVGRHRIVNCVYCVERFRYEK